MNGRTDLNGHLSVKRREVPDPVTGAAGLPHDPGKPVHDIVDVLCRHAQLPSRDPPREDASGSTPVGGGMCEFLPPATEAVRAGSVVAGLPMVSLTVVRSN
ncbi:hypothetical protein GCM10023191_079040 [Actinoallomurus oryzae]|uniref:Uncharacterized protein n=1 Tax=Actinoallomurus oryzae TaxID=502180 RepID=A0ABP8QXX3_9ACTN